MSRPTSPTPAELSAADRELLAYLLAKEGLTSPGPEAIRPRPDPSARPLSFAQERLFFLSRLEADPALYTIPLAVRLEGALEVKALRRALSRIVARHEVLRTIVPSGPLGGAQPRLLAAEDIALPLLDLSEGSPSAREADLERLVRAEARRPFELSIGPLFRATLLRLGDDEHALLVSLHHLVADAWSLGLLVRELAAFYEEEVLSRPASPPDLSIQYADFAHWQRESLGGEALARQLEYWKGQLTGAPPVLGLPTDRPRPPVQGSAGAYVKRTFAPELLEALQVLARGEGATLFMVLLAGFKAFLARYTGDTDIAVGSPIAGRTRKEVEPLLGLFVNTLVMRTDCSGDPTVSELVRRVREVALQAYANQEVPFERVVEALNPTRAASHSPLFQVAFNLQNAPLEALRLPGLTLRPIETATNTAKFDLAFYLTETSAGLRAVTEYATDLFDASTVERMLGLYERTLRQMVERPKARVSELSLLGHEERHQLLGEWSTASAFPARASLVHERFEEQARSTPHAIALRGGDGSMTYGELEARANQWARALRARGVGPEVRVGLCADHGPRLVLGALAVLKAGGAYVALDPDLPEERVGHVLRDSGARLVLTEGPFEEKLTRAGLPCLRLDGAEAPDPDEAALPSGLVARDNLAYVIYTSGSTGLPKGVELTHDGLANLVDWHIRDYDVRPEDRATQVAGLGFDASVWEVWPYLAAGASVAFPGRDVRADPSRLRDWLVNEGITLTFLPTPLAEAVLQGAWPAGGRIRALLTGGDRLRKRPSPGTGFALINHYGPTENTVVATAGVVEPDSGEGKGAPSIGRPISGVRVYLLDESQQPVPLGVWGEMYLGGRSVGRGYSGRPDLTAASFVPDPFSGEGGARLYRTGDLCRYRADGSIEFGRRIDQQVKVRGHRIELGEIEATLRHHPDVQEAVVVVRGEAAGEAGLVAYVVWPDAGDREWASLREHLRRRLPEYMVPRAFVALSRLPLTASGKVDRAALPAPAESRAADRPAGPGLPTSQIERGVAEVWKEVLGRETVGPHDNFFDLGGHSLLLVQVHERLRARFPQSELKVVDLFRYSTVRALAEHLDDGSQEAARPTARAPGREGSRDPIAIIGMTGRFPKARDLGELWERLRNGEECITFFTDEELRAAGVAEEQIRDPKYVRARGVLEGEDLFDAAFFGYTPREAEVMDPQQRVFLECAAEALDNAGYDPQRYPGLIGLFAGLGLNRYLLQLASDPELLKGIGAFPLLVASDKDFLPSRVSYKLDLRGPSVNVQTACSTSLVAVHLACQSLWSRECDMALAGGVSIAIPQRLGYHYQEEGIGSPDGHCRAFDADARGTVSGSGAALVVLKRLEDALRDGDLVRAVIKGSAINNDGGQKVGYTAPSVTGQASVIAAAQAVAGVSPETIGYVEAHGTGTSLGDPVEMEALSQAFGPRAEGGPVCALGSLKTNVGHLDAAAGVAGLIKTVLALEHKQIPPSLHFKRPNPKIDFAKGPFRVSTALTSWESTGPRRAGVSSFGIGGTNAHVVVEEAPPCEAAPTSASEQLLVWSARTPGALEEATRRLRAHMGAHPEQDLADVAYTLQRGRRLLAHRRAVVVRDLEDAAAALADPARLEQAQAPSSALSVVFLFPGQGTQYVDMGRGLYESEVVFKETVDECAALLEETLGVDLRTVLYPSEAERDRAAEQLVETGLTQPALFAIELAASRLWMSLGVKPVAMIGHSLGEYVAAHLAGVFTLEGALSLVAARGRLMQGQPRGAMLAVPLPEREVRSLLGDHLSLAAVNAPESCVASGPVGEIEALQGRLEARGIEARRIQTSHAFHSSMMDGAMDAFREQVARVPRSAPTLPFLSNVTGDWITPEQATDPAYWSTHLRGCVRFSDGLVRLLGRSEDHALLEVGPGRTLTGLARQHELPGRRQMVVPSLRQPRDATSDRSFFLRGLGQLWVAGTAIDWDAARKSERRRVELPSYPFERQRYWLEPRSKALVRPEAARVRRASDPADFFYVPSWRRKPQAASVSVSAGTWLLMGEGSGLGDRLARVLRGAGGEVVQVVERPAFTPLGEGRYGLRPGSAEDHAALLDALRNAGKAPDLVLHLWSLTGPGVSPPGLSGLDRAQERGVLSLMHLVRALGAGPPDRAVRVAALTDGMQEVAGEGLPHPEKASLVGPVRVAPLEYPNVLCRSLDLPVRDAAAWSEAEIEDWLRDVSSTGDGDSIVAYRGGERWVLGLEPLRLEGAPEAPARLRTGGCYLVTGGLGGVGLALADYLARAVEARLVLTGRTGLPEREAWPTWLLSHPADEATSRRIRSVQALEASGAIAVHVAAADVTDPDAMRAVFAAAEARFGRIDGVIHAAGIAGGGAIEGRRPEAALAVLRPKLAGALVIDALARERGVELVVLCSSLASVLGGFGQADYCGANASLDAFARHARGQGGPFTVSVNWDRWREVGMAVEAELPDDLARARSRQLAFGLSTREGTEAFARVLRERQPQVLVSTLDLEARTAGAPRSERAAAEDREAVAPEPPVTLEQARPRHRRPDLGVPLVAPRDEVEERVAAVFEDLLGFEEVGVHDGFFELGGHSLLATQVLTRLNADFGSRLTLRRLFDAATVAGLAAEIRVDRGTPALDGAAADAEPAGAPTTAEDAPILSFAQERMWFLDRLDPGNPAFNLGLAFRCRGDLDLDVLDRALRHIVSRHEVLRTRFPEHDGQPAPAVEAAAPLDLRRIDFVHLPESERASAAARYAAEELQRPFDLAAAPLLRAASVRLGDREHVILLSAHHVVADGWSMGLLSRELGTLYGAFVAGKRSPLPALRLQYGDLARVERDRLTGTALVAEIDYWRKKLADAPALLELPTDREADPAALPSSGSLSTELDAGVAANLRDLSQREGATLFMALLAGFQALLSRLSGQTDVVVGTAVSNRPSAEAEASIGPFLNTLALRVDHSGDPTFRELLGRAKEVTLEALAHQDVPFERLLEDLHPRRDLAHPPLFRVFFNMLSFAEIRLQAAGLEFEPFRVGGPDAKFDLTLYALERGGRIALQASYRADRFEASTVERLLSQLRLLLEQAVAHPDRPLSRADLVTAETRALLPDPAAPLLEVGLDAVPVAFEGWARRTPGAIALRQSGRQLSYAALAEAAQEVARSLRACGVVPGDVVAVEGAPSFGLVAALLGVLRSGGALLALEGSLPAARRLVMQREANARVLLRVGTRESDTTSTDPATTVVAVDAETGRPLGTRAHESVSLPEVGGDDPAYVFFTSGTTGVPKGVLGCHKGLAHFVAWQRDTFGVGPGDRSSQLTGLSFDVVLREIFLPLTSGATLCLRPSDHELGPDEVLGWLEHEGVTVLHTVPALARTWLVETPASVTLEALRFVFMAGEPLTSRLVRQWRSRFPGAARIVNLYGPTETTLAKCFYEVPEAPREGIQPVGRPLPQTQALVLGAGDRLCGIGEAGEIVIRTPYRSLGYVNAPAETAKRFFPNPFRRDAKDQLYRTGDRGRVLPDGSLEILGRLDQQVKVRGARVELGEIESVLASHEAVAECVVVAIAEPGEDARLVAYVVPRRGTAPGSTSLRQYLKERLPEYMVPSAVSLLAALPLTANGKLDRRALPAPAWVTEDRGEAVAPRSPLEEQVASIWQELLGVEGIGVHDDFFELGGHSLLATRVAARLRARFGIEVSLRRLFEATTVARLAEHVQIVLRGDGSLALPPVTPVVREGDLVPASFAQQRLWFLQQFHTESAAYNISHRVLLRGRLDVAALEQALTEVVRRHGALRTTFTSVGGRPIQRVNPPAPLRVALVDLRDREPEAGRLELQRRAREEMLRPFDLGQGPLFRVSLVRLSDDEQALLLSMHHTVADSWSLGILARETSALYAAFRDGRPSPLPEPPVQYADYSIWQHRQWEAGALRGQLEYWKERLRGAAVLDVPGDRPRPLLPSGRGGRIAFSLPEPLVRRLDGLGRERGATLFMTLLAAFQVLLHRHTGETDIAVGTPIANRRASELDGLIGFFVNMLVLRTDLADDPTFTGLVGRVREVALSAYAHQDVPFEKLVEEIHPERTLGQNPLFQVMFILQTAPRGILALEGLAPAAAAAAETTGGALKTGAEPSAARFDLTLDLTDWGGRVSGYLEYNADLFDEETASRFVRQFCVLLEGAVEAPERRLSEMPLIAPDEERLLLADWNATDETFAPLTSLAAAFEEQVALTPEAEALREHGRSTDYRSLNEAANRLARYLRRLGVGPETVVGLCLERSVEAVIGILGILKAGGAFLPLDPEHPRQRLEFMVDDSRALVIVTRSALAGVLERNGARLVCLDTERDAMAIAEESPLDLGLAAAPDQPAYAIYTSGSTGVPKGVVGTHRGTLNRLHWMWRRYPFVAGEVCAQKTALTFVDSIAEIFGPLLRGVPGVVVPDDVGKDPRLLLDTLATARVSRLVLVPSLLRALLATAPDALVLPRLRYWFTSGEALSAELVGLFQQKVATGALVNLYGSSEAAADSTCHEVDVQALATRVPIGRPISNTQVYIFDSRMRPVPRGVPGELYLGGAGLARGYLHRPELTAERFLPHPFEQGARLYRTGDRARFQADGTVEYLGRVDHQVKIRGMRVELGEVETALRREPSVREAVVVAQAASFGTRLVAYVVLVDPEEKVDDLRRALRDRLPEHMVPALFVTLSALPLTPSGKVDRIGLPAPETAAPESTFVAPGSPVEEVLAGVWEELLGRERVSVHDDFFDLGGHSLLATQLAVRVRDLLGVELPLAQVFEHPTVAGLARILQEAPEAERRAVALLRLAALDEQQVESLLGAAPLASGQDGGDR